MRTVTLAAADDVAGFRAAIRSLLQQGVDADRVQWRVAESAERDLFEEAEERPEPPRANENIKAPIRLPAFFVPLFERAALHVAPARHGLLYRLAWRLVRESALRHDPLDPDRLRAEQWAREVRREMHKMTAFVRFRPVAAEGGGDSVTHIAWFEPAHPIVRASAPFFARRFAQLRWAILTPARCVRWDGRQLEFSAGARREDAPAADAAERLWLTYYENIFNPARLKIAMMKKEMPRRYWKNLPEAALIDPLVASAHQRSQRMVEQGGTEPAHRRPAASMALRNDQRAQALVPAPVGTLAALREGTARCRACPIGEHATQAVNGEGPHGARLMLVGEQPGDQEDLRGRPFVGPAGRLLHRALADLGWPRDTLYVTNAVKHFKFELRGKRRIHKTPAQQEVLACRNWLESEIALVQPQVLVALGATAARSLLGRTVAVMTERGCWLQRGDGLKVLVTLHPSALLRMDPVAFEAAYAAWLQDLRQAAKPPPAA
ncbi:MAG: UdgX family uracil-DNA binding protein [Burkholderiaceae bacterium]